MEKYNFGQNDFYLLSENLLGIDNLDDLTHNGAVGSEIFDGFELLDVDAAKRIYMNGRDDKGHCFSLATWAVLGYFVAKWS